MKSLALGDKLPDGSEAAASMSNARLAQLKQLEEAAAERANQSDSADDLDSEDKLSRARKRDDEVDAPRWRFQLILAALIILSGWSDTP